MSDTKRHSNFAPVPERAIGDARLTCSHWRVLAAIAVHDRLSTRRKQGAGCYASNKTLSQKCGIHYTNFSTVVRELGAWGYIVAAPHPINKRTRVYRVIYDEANRDDTLPTDKPSSPIQPDNTLPTDEEPAGIVCPPNQQPVENTQHPNDKYIPLNGNRFSETGKHSAEAAPIVIGDGLRAKRTDENDGAYLAMLERSMKELGYAALPDLEQRQVIAIVERHDTDDPLYHQAQRVLSTWGEETPD